VAPTVRNRSGAGVHASGESEEATMRRRRWRLWLCPLTICAGVFTGRGGVAQDRPAPRAPTTDDRAAPPTSPPLPPALLPPPPTAGTPAATLSRLLIPPAPEPIPGPASAGLPQGGRSIPTSRGLPINLA